MVNFDINVEILVHFPVTLNVVVKSTMFVLLEVQQHRVCIYSLHLACTAFAFEHHDVFGTFLYECIFFLFCSY